MALMPTTDGARHLASRAAVGARRRLAALPLASRRRGAALRLVGGSLLVWAVAAFAAAVAWAAWAPWKARRELQLGFRGPSASGAQARVASALVAAAGGDGEADALSFEPREVGSAEQLMLSRMPAGHMITTHSFVALVTGDVDLQRLSGALRWATIRHPMLRACAQEPPAEKNQDIGPFVHAGKDGRWMFVPSSLSVAELVSRALTTEDLTGEFEETWKGLFEASLDKSTFDFEAGPLWRLKLLRKGKENALLFSFVHSLDDQRSGNIFLHDVLTHMEAAAGGTIVPDPEPLPVPKSIEDVFLTDEVDIQKLVGYALAQAELGSKPSVMIPSALRSAERDPKKHWALDPTQPVAKNRPLTVPVAPADGNAKMLFAESVDLESIFAPEKRQNLVSLRRLPADVLTRLRATCRQNNVTVSMAIAAAALLATSDVGHDERDFGYEVYRLLMGVDMRRFAPGGDWTQDTVSFASGALDFALRMLPKSGEAYSAEDNNKDLRSRIGGVPFWDLARASDLAVKTWVEKGYAAESTRLFDFGVKFLRMDKIIQETAKDPNTLGRAYSVTISNAGVYSNGPPEGNYGSLRLDSVFFGISSSVSGSMVAASCLTVNGELLITAHGSTPIVNRTDLDAFSDSMLRSLTIAAVSPVPFRGSSGKPLVDNPMDPRNGKPWYYPVETPKGQLRCPTYEDVRSPTLRPFDVDKYVGIWYELAFHDITQFNGCGCTRFNMTRKDLVIEDMFTVACPWPWKEGVDGPWLPGFAANGNRRLNQYTCNMTMYYEPARPGVMLETGFGQEFDNMVLEIWSDPDLVAQTGYEYTRAIQFQCLGDAKEGITFVGINFLSRVPIVSPAMVQEMFVRARALGLEPYGSNDMHVIDHQGCRYPESTHVSWMGERPEWPSVILDKELGALV